MQHFVLGLAPSTALTLLWVEKTEVLPGPQRRGSGGRSLECCHLCIMRGRQGDVHTLSATGGLPGRHGVWGGSQARRLGSRAWGRGSRREGAGPPEVRQPPPKVHDSHDSWSHCVLGQPFLASPSCPQGPASSLVDLSRNGQAPPRVSISPHVMGGGDDGSSGRHRGLSVCLCPPVRGWEWLQLPVLCVGGVAGSSTWALPPSSPHISVPRQGPLPCVPRSPVEMLAWGERAFTPQDLGQAFKP